MDFPHVPSTVHFSKENIPSDACHGDCPLFPSSAKRGRRQHKGADIPAPRSHNENKENPFGYLLFYKKKPSGNIFPEDLKLSVHDLYCHVCFPPAFRYPHSSGISMPDLTPSFSGKPQARRRTPSETTCKSSTCSDTPAGRPPRPLTGWSPAATPQPFPEKISAAAW